MAAVVVNAWQSLCVRCAACPSPPPPLSSYVNLTGIFVRCGAIIQGWGSFRRPHLGPVFLALAACLPHSSCRTFFRVMCVLLILKLWVWFLSPRPLPYALRLGRNLAQCVNFIHSLVVLPYDKRNDRFRFPPDGDGDGYGDGPGRPGPEPVRGCRGVQLSGGRARGGGRGWDGREDGKGTWRCMRKFPHRSAGLTLNVAVIWSVVGGVGGSRDTPPPLCSSCLWCGYTLTLLKMSTHDVLGFLSVNNGSELEETINRQYLGNNKFVVVVGWRGTVVQH